MELWSKQKKKTEYILLFLFPTVKLPFALTALHILVLFSASSSSPTCNVFPALFKVFLFILSTFGRFSILLRSNLSLSMRRPSSLTVNHSPFQIIIPLQSLEAIPGDDLMEVGYSQCCAKMS